MQSGPTKSFVRRVLVALVGLVTIAVAPAALALARGDYPDAAPDIIVQLAAAHLPEPLTRTLPTRQSEDRALLQALAAFKQRAEPDDFTSLISFLAKHPHSGWRVALLANIGLSRLHYGYYSRALDYLAAAWREGKAADGTDSKALVDRAVGELVLLHARLGHAEKVDALLKEIGDRPVSGPATETVQLAREALWVMQNDPRHMWLCGPLALKFLMLSEKASPEQVQFLQRYRAGPKGVSLEELARLAEKAGASYVPVFRDPGQPVPVPSIVHWNTGHYAAILSEQNGQYWVYDPVLGVGDRSVTAGALKTEASGYFLVRAETIEPGGWRKVAGAEAGQVWGAGPTNGPPPNFANGSPANPPCDCPLTTYNISEVAVGVMLTDTPVGYVPPKGPSTKVTIAYNQREASQPALFKFFNVGSKWTFNFQTYIQDDPNFPGSSVIRYRPNGGDSPQSGFNSQNGAFAADELDGSILVLSSKNPVIYRRKMPDGTVETYAQSDGSTSYPRRVFLSKVTDAQGNALSLKYQLVSNQVRLSSLTDATGRHTTFTYGLASSPLLITKITDPFGRSAKLTYDGSGRLASITDVLGLTSSFTYDANSLVRALTTPYGTTKFAYGGTGNTRFVQVTDPLGHHERVETLQPAGAVPFSDPANTVPQGIEKPFNKWLSYRNTFHWDKHAYVAAGCTPYGGCDYSQARLTHFTHDANNINSSWQSIESRKYPLENRIWYNLPGQNSNPNCTLGTACAGTYDQPSAIGRVLDDGTTQLFRYTYNAAGNLTSFVDPAGRTANFTYAPNLIDLTEVGQTTANGSVPIARYLYNTRHQPLTYTDAAGRTTEYSYNAAGQVTRVALPLGRVWKFTYDSLGRLIRVVNPHNVAAITYAYDAFDRIAAATDSEGYAVHYAYDAADRFTSITFPDGTSRNYTYKNLDLLSATDRQGRTTKYTYDANRNLVSVTNPLGGTTKYAYFENDALKSLTDPNGHTTSWTIDVQGRVTRKQFADGSNLRLAYEATTSRLHSVTDALGQTKQYRYTVDDRVAGITYGHAKNSTPNISFIYDPYFPRLTGSSDQNNGATQYAYVPIGSPGALKLKQERFARPNATINYRYDAGGRLIARTIDNTTQETFGYDTLGRLVAHTNPLGHFVMTYLGQTPQQTGMSRLGTTFKLNSSYRPNSGDRRLAVINNAPMRRLYRFTTNPESLISAITEESPGGSRSWNYLYDAANRLISAKSSTGPQFGIALDPAGNIRSLQLASGKVTYSYNSLNELIGGSTGQYTYDAAGNRLTDGQTRTYAWDAEDRLAATTSSTKSTTQFSYDAMGRRVAIGSTQFLWCGSQICQSRTAGGAVLRQYYAEGEYIPASGTKLYYGRDQLGSVRNVTVVSKQGTTVQAYDFDPFGNVLSPSAGGTRPDFRYAGMYYHANSGLYLTKYRAYDPRTARWLSRDPLGEMAEVAPLSASPRMANPALRTLPPLSPSNTISLTPITLPGAAARAPAVPVLTAYNPAANNRSNLYLYVSGDPVNRADRLGLQDFSLQPGQQINLPRGYMLYHEPISGSTWVHPPNGQPYAVPPGGIACKLRDINTWFKTPNWDPSKALDAVEHSNWPISSDVSGDLVTPGLTNWLADGGAESGLFGDGGTPSPGGVEVGGDSGF